MAAEYWIWSNLHGAWEAETGYTFFLQLAKRYQPEEAVRRVYLAEDLDDDPLGWPTLVAIPVTNNYLPPGAREAMSLAGVNPDLSEVGDLPPEERAKIVERFEKIWERALTKARAEKKA